MSFLDLAKKRYSVREYETKKVEKEKLLTILEAGRVAPTAANRQPTKLIVVQEAEGLNKLIKTANTYGAPLAIIICSEQTTAWVRPFDKKVYGDIDTTIVTDHMMLQATELGLGTVWIGYFDPKIIQQEFNLPDHVEPINILAIGYSIGNAASPDRHGQARKPLASFVSYETY